MGTDNTVLITGVGVCGIRGFGGKCDGEKKRNNFYKGYASIFFLENLFNNLKVTENTTIAINGILRYGIMR